MHPGCCPTPSGSFDDSRRTRAIPWSTRLWVYALLVYLASPIDLIPDFIPVIGYADDAIITSFVLRYVIARSGPEKLVEHWPGTADGLALLRRVLRIATDLTQP